LENLKTDKPQGQTKNIIVKVAAAQVSLVRDVILLNNAGVASSGGKIPTTILEMTRDCVAFLHALGLEEIDVVDFSLGAGSLNSYHLTIPNSLDTLF